MAHTFQGVNIDEYPNRQELDSNHGRNYGISICARVCGLEFLHEMPKGISIYGEANTITVWHFPLIWLLAGLLFYCVFYAVRIIRDGKTKERTVTFSVSVAVAALLALFWLYPMLAHLMQCFGRSGC
jgi:hypothetical protein